MNTKTEHILLKDISTWDELTLELANAKIDYLAISQINIIERLFISGQPLRKGLRLQVCKKVGGE